MTIIIWLVLFRTFTTKHCVCIVQSTKWYKILHIFLTMSTFNTIKDACSILPSEISFNILNLGFHFVQNTYTMADCLWFLLCSANMSSTSRCSALSWGIAGKATIKLKILVLSVPVIHDNAVFIDLSLNFRSFNIFR